MIGENTGQLLKFLKKNDKLWMLESINLNDLKHLLLVDCQQTGFRHISNNREELIKWRLKFGLLMM